MNMYVVRTMPLTNEAMIVDALSRSNGRLKAHISGKDVEIGFDTYQASGSVDMDAAKKIVQAYAKQHNIPETEVVVRARLPKTNASTISMPRQRKQRATNDANLKLVQDSPQDYRSKNEREGKPDNFRNTVQAMHDNATGKQSEQKAPEDKQPVSSDNKSATADNPQGAVVKTEGKRTKRAYSKKTAERSKRSKAAYERYVKELSQQIEKTPEIMEPVAANPSMSQEQVDENIMNLALAIAKVLKSGVL